MKKRISIQAVIFLVTLLIPVMCLAMDRYVSTTGSNITGDGTVANPWQTIQFAVTNSLAGDVIHIAAGTYMESNITVDKTLSITGNPSNRESVIVAPVAEDGNADNPFGNNAQNGFVIKAHDITISNLTLNGRGNPGLTYEKNNFRAAIITLDPSQAEGGVWNNLHISNVLIKYAYRRGISVFPRNVTGTLIENCSIDHIAFNHAIYLAGQGSALNNVINYCFQGIVLNPDATTPAGVIKANGNILTNIGNFPGCWGDLGSGNYLGQPRGIQFDNASGTPRAVEINNNQITNLNFGSDAVGIYTRRADENSLIENNNITFLLCNGAEGILVGWSYANGCMVRNNTLIVSGTSCGISIFGSGSVEKPVYLEGNTLFGVNPLYTQTGEGTGVVVSNKYLNGTDVYESYVIIRNNNSITGFIRGIDVVNMSLTDPSPLTVEVIDNPSSIEGNAYGIIANFGDLIITGNRIAFNSNCGIALTGSATALIQNNEINNNQIWGLNNATGTTTDATNNWWGACSGPYHATNPTGTGNPVSDNVSFIPWNIGVTAYTVTGGGTYCEGGLGLAVGLANSQQSVNYQLYRNGTPAGNPIPGTGSSISFGLQTEAGTYIVAGTSTVTGCILNMPGSATITVSPLPMAAGTVTGPTQVQQGQEGVIYTVAPIANAIGYAWILPPGATITSGANSNIITVTFTATAISGDIRVSGTNACGLGQFSPNLYINVIPTQLNVTNTIISNGETRCFDAIQVITVAGNGTQFFVLSGGDATFIAGQKIRLLPGTTVEAGGKLKAYITTTGQYCNGTLPPGANPGQNYDDDNLLVFSKTDLFKVYPNPTPGRFTLELNPDIDAATMTMAIFGMRGEMVMKQQIPATRKSEFSLQDKQSGIYLIRLMIGDRVETAKIIKIN